MAQGDTRKTTAAETVKWRKWMIRHAVRLPAKKGDVRALELRAAGGAVGLDFSRVWRISHFAEVVAAR